MIESIHREAWNEFTNRVNELRQYADNIYEAKTYEILQFLTEAFYQEFDDSQSEADLSYPNLVTLPCNVFDYILSVMLYVKMKDELVITKDLLHTRCVLLRKTILSTIEDLAKYESNKDILKTYNELQNDPTLIKDIYIVIFINNFILYNYKFLKTNIIREI